MKVCINGQGHMTKMAAMAVNRKKNFKRLLLQNREVCDFETWHEASWNVTLQSLYNFLRQGQLRSPMRLNGQK